MNTNASRNIYLLLISLASIFAYEYGLGVYLNALTNPLLMKVALSMSLAIAVIYSIKGGLNDSSKIAAVSTFIVFGVAVFAAIEVREFYMDLTTHMRATEGVDQVIGQEYIDAMKNRAVGIGACFALSLAIARAFLFKRVSTILSKSLMGFDISKLCPHCGQPSKGVSSK